MKAKLRILGPTPDHDLRPKPESHKDMDHIGPTGILAFVDVGVKVTIEGTRPGSPAEGKVKAGEVILGVNGQALEGLNPYVVLGKAITRAEASDGTLVFDLKSKSGERQVTITIPVLGAWGDNWPVDCPKTAASPASLRSLDLLGHSHELPESHAAQPSAVISVLKCKA